MPVICLHYLLASKHWLPEGHAIKIEIFPQSGLLVIDDAKYGIRNLNLDHMEHIEITAEDVKIEEKP